MENKFLVLINNFKKGHMCCALIVRVREREREREKERERERKKERREK
jgi:hypothetical protein